MSRSRTLMAVAALTVAAAIAVQHHLHRRKVRALQAAALAERLAAGRAHEAYVHQVGEFVDRIVADEQVVETATQVIDREWARNQIEDGDEGHD